MPTTRGWFPNHAPLNRDEGTMKTAHHQAGMTILELLITLAILGIVSFMAVPSFIDTLDRMNSSSAARSLAATFTLARSEAVKAGLDVSICGSQNGADCAANGWNGGWIVFIDANADADGAAGSIDAGDRILRVYEPLGGMVVTVAPATNIVRYDSKGYGKNASLLTFTMCPLDGDASNARQIELGLSGRARFIDEVAGC
jgi:type IV fimbrial biogenesis protein FimT